MLAVLTVTIVGNEHSYRGVCVVRPQITFCYAPHCVPQYRDLDNGVVSFTNPNNM